MPLGSGCGPEDTAMWAPGPLHPLLPSSPTCADRGMITDLYEPPPPDGGDGGDDGAGEEPPMCVPGSDGTCETNTPIILPLPQANRYSLTSSAGGVRFDLNADGVPEQTGWTAAESRLAFLAIDRNENGIIDDGSELLGNRTVPGVDNGFTALQHVNMQLNGGIPVTMIAEGEPLYERLLLWEDANHNGISEARELQPAANLFKGVGTGYEIHQRRDGHGNLFRFRGEASLRWSLSEQTIFVYDVIFAR